MPEKPQQKHRTNRVFKSLHKRLTYLGVERTLFYFVCVGAVGAFNPFNSILAGVAVFLGGFAFGHWVTNSDPAFLRGLQGDANAEFTGAPVLQRLDPATQFDWNAATPAPGIPRARFGVRWSGTFTAPAPGKYGFSFSMAHCSTCEDEETVNVWLDDKQVYNFKHAHTHGRRAPTTPFDLDFSDTNPHGIRIEYTHDAPIFGAGLTFNWKPPADALRQQPGIVAAPPRQLIGFTRVHLEAGESEEVHFALDARQLSLVNAGGVRQTRPGKYELYLGGGPPQASAGQGVC